MSTIKVTNINDTSNNASIVTGNNAFTVNGTVVTGVSAGSTTITAEGGSTTTNLQQGLIKMWAGMDVSVTILDSFNVSSVRDDAAGRTTFFINNDMANAGYSLTGMENQGEANTCMGQSLAATGFQFNVYSGSAYVDRDCGVKVSGDLA